MTDDKWPRIVVGIPMERTGTPDDDITYNFFNIFQQGWPLVRVPYMSSASARNRMARALLESDKFTHLVMLDIDHLHPADVVGTGSIIIAREAFEQLKPQYPFFCRDHGTWDKPSNSGDDVRFCEICRAAGIKLWVDPLNTSPHLTEHWVTGHDWVQFVTGHRDEYEIDENGVATMDLRTKR